MKLNNLIIDLKIIILCGILILGSCSKDDEQVKDSDPISSRFGEFVSIPDFDPKLQISSELLATESQCSFFTRMPVAIVVFFRK